MVPAGCIVWPFRESRRGRTDRNLGKKETKRTENRRTGTEDHDSRAGADRSRTAVAANLRATCNPSGRISAAAGLFRAECGIGKGARIYASVAGGVCRTRKSGKTGAGAAIPEKSGISEYAAKMPGIPIWENASGL